MFLPFSASIGLWIVPKPIFELEQVPPPPPPAPADPCNSSTALDTDGQLPTTPPGGTQPNGMPAGDLDEASLVPQMRLVLKGYRWEASAYWTARENHSYESVAQARLDQDDQDSDERLRDARARQTLVDTDEPKSDLDSLDAETMHDLLRADDVPDVDPDLQRSTTDFDPR